MISEITDINNVEIFFHDLINEGLNGHPDEDFSQYINIETDEPSYTPQEAAVRNDLMAKAFEVCEAGDVDIYDMMQEIYLKETGLDKYIPLPSREYKEQ